MSPDPTWQEIQTLVYESLRDGIIDSAGVGVDEDFDGIIALNFEKFRPTPGFEMNYGKLPKHSEFGYFEANQDDPNKLPYRLYPSLTKEEYTQSLTAFWTGALAKYKEEFPNARFAMYQAPRAFIFTGPNGWGNPNAANRTPGADVNQTNFDAEAAWLYPLLDVIAIHDYMSVQIGDPNAGYDDLRDYHRDLAIRGIRVAREYRKPCFAYFTRNVQKQDQPEVSPDEMRAWYDGYLEALANTGGGWPMMGVAFWAGAFDRAPNVGQTNAFLRNVFVPAFIERFTIGTMNGLQGVMAAGD